MSDPSRPIPAIIPFYKNQRQLDLCKAALEKQDLPTDAWVHDNSVNNLYFTKAVNRGLRKAIHEGHEFAISLNQDCYLRPDAARNMVEFMRSHPRCGVAGIKQVLARDEDQIVHGGCTMAYPTGYHITGRKSLGNCTASARMPWVNGACVIVRIEGMLDFGVMDENMMLVASDSDWCYTARARNWEVWYCATAECVHEMGVSFSQQNPELTRLMIADMDFWAEKWIGSSLHARLEAEFRPMTGIGAYARLG
jgi:GT2 family glycosyltransferase